jgi:hypothetical protein
MNDALDVSEVLRDRSLSRMSPFFPEWPVCLLERSSAQAYPCQRKSPTRRISHNHSGNENREWRLPGCLAAEKYTIEGGHAAKSKILDSLDTV